MDVNTIKATIDQGILAGCGLGLAGLGFFSFAMWLRRVPRRVFSFAKKAGWATVAVLFSFGVWATANSYLTQEEKEAYNQQPQQMASQNSAMGTVLIDGSLLREEMAKQNVLKPERSELVGNGCFDGCVSDTLRIESETGSDSDLPSVRELIADDYVAGLVLTRIGTGETFDFASPEGSDVREDWTAYGAARDWFRTHFTNDWSFVLGTNTVDALTVFSYGTARPRMKDKETFISPLESSLGLVPAANWDQLDCGPSQFWQLLTPSNTLVMTWRNGLLNRDENSPVSFQMECWPEGQIQFRYDLSRLSDSIVSNLVVGIRNEGAGRVFTQLVRGTTSLTWGRVTMDDLENPDRDGDGLATVDELMIWHTDPDFWDSDGDGLSDGEEIALGTNPLVRDVDGDGFVDGSDPDPLAATSLADLDEDTLPDAYENHWFGSTNVIDTASSFGPDGFSYAFDLEAGHNPTDGPDVVFLPTNRIAAWKLTEAFVAQTSQRGLVYERTLPISRHGSWEQFFVSSRPDRAGDWRLEGLSLEWEDSEGETGVADRSPRDDSLYLPVSTNSPARLTIRLRATAAAVSCRKPLYLLAYSPSVSFDGGMPVETSDTIWRVVTIKEETSLPLAIDQTGRPCKAPLYPQELSASYPASADAMGFEAGGEAVISSPGVYELPHINLADYREGARRLRRARSNEEPNGTAKNYLACLNPKLTYGTGHHYGGYGLTYFAEENRYEETYAYPLDSACLWRSWHSDATGGYVCSCEPELSVGFDISGFPDISTNVTVAAEVATGTISIGGTEVWRDAATHDVSSFGGSGIELLSDDECDECSSCAEGNCDSLEGPELGSLKFRIPLGVPRKDQVSGFAWLRTEGPVSMGLQTLQLLARSDAQITDTRTASTRVIACRDNRGRTLTISPIDDGIEIVITETDSGRLEHTWRITNESRSASRIRLQKVSRQNNLMSDTTFVYANGEWTEFDNISESSEQLIVEDSLSTDGVKSEERIVRDLDGHILSHTITDLTRIGSFADAVLRETYHAEKGWGDNWKESFASYYDDSAHPKRHGNVRLVWGNDRPWKFSAYDGEGRPVLTLEQHNGSACPTNELAWIGADYFDDSFPLAVLPYVESEMIVTHYDYSPHVGDSADSRDVDKVRTESRYLVRSGYSTLISRNWTKYVRWLENGYPTLTVETITAGAQDAELDDARNAHTVETTYDEDAPGVPLVLRGALLRSTDADQITTENVYTIGDGILVQKTQLSYADEAYPTYSLVETDLVYGNTLRTATCLASDDTPFDETWYCYDEKNRFVSTRYADGSFSTNAYSCCRLLWTRDRNGMKTVRSATTGRDHLYYAMEEVSLAQLPHDNRYIPYGTLRSVDNHYRVTQHFMDALGRETNTTVRVAQVQGCATNQYYVFNKGWRTSETTSYPDGVSDYEIAIDARGNETTTKRYAYSDREVVETIEAIETNKTTIATTYRNGRNLIREEWSDGKWKETEMVIAYYENGCRTDTTTVTTSDHEPIVTQTIYRDFLGRTIREVRPTSDVTYAYDGTSSRVLTAVDSISGETATRLYDECGEAVGQLKNGITSRSDTDYEVESNTLWRVSTLTTSGGTRSVASVTKERLTGLSNELRSESFAYQNGALALHSYSWFDPTNFVLTEVSESATAGTVTTKSKFGIVFETITEAGTTSNFFDPYGRVFYTEKDGRSVDWIGRNDYGDVEEYDTFFASGDNVYAEFYGYDNFDNRTSATNALGAVTVSTYDLAHRLSESSGAVYPVRYSYDTENRRTALSTTRDGINWDTTSWTFNPATGFRTVKTYADGTTVVYSYTPDGKPLRTTYASGRWHENAYNAKRELVSTTYSDGETCAFAYDEFSNEVTSSNDVSAIVSTRNNYGQATNETIAVGSETYSLDRSFDAYGRMIRNDSSDYTLAPDGQLAAISNALASVEYLYTADLLDAGYMIALPNGVSFTRSLTRDAYRRSLVTGIESSVGGNVIESFAYSYDALNRPTTRNADIFGYNDRSEIVFSRRDTESAEDSYAYDSIGNLTASATSNGGCEYTANNLNQYTSILRASAPPCDGKITLSVPDGEEGDDSEEEDFTLRDATIDLAKMERIQDFRKDLEHDVQALNEFYSNLADFQAKFKSGAIKDTKLERLMELLSEKQSKANRKAIVFTTFGDTAEYLYEQVSKAHPEWRVACVTGQKVLTTEPFEVAGQSAFQTVLQRFAPYSKLYKEKDWNDLYVDAGLRETHYDPVTRKWSVDYDLWRAKVGEIGEPKMLELLESEIDILIATDCLSEGQNLQDSDLVINYDIHWNPVRLIQRFGRMPVCRD